MPKHVMVCVSGFSGTGKDEFVSRIVRRHMAVQTGLADPAKRHMADVYGFTEKQLFGPSEFRNAGDLRYLKNTMNSFAVKPDPEEPGTWVISVGPRSDMMGEGACTLLEASLNKSQKLPKVVRSGTLDGYTEFRVQAGDPRVWLSPREALQLYCEKLNHLWINTWIHKGIADQKRIASGEYYYSRMAGPHRSGGDWTWGMKNVVTCFADFRHIHEFSYARKHGPAKTILVRLKRPSIPTPPFDHRSETEQVMVRDAAFDYVVDNDQGVEELHAKADAIMDDVLEGSAQPKEWDEWLVDRCRTPEQGYAK